MTVQPRFRGLFAGINRYQSANVRNLAGAVRDAEALHALFADNLGGITTLITDGEVTADRLRTELTALATESSEDDVVVVTYSGHGSDTHELVTYEADIFDLAGSTLPLEEFTGLISSIPAKHLLVVLDCCFSGGAGAKVLKSPLHSRGGTGMPLSTDAFLSRMAGTGRVLLTAATADQEAYENPRLGHGYLTYHLMQALMGAPGGAINPLNVLNDVVARVKLSVSGTYAVLQEPTLRGQWDGEVVWPNFNRGPLFDAIFPPTTPALVTTSIRSLDTYKLPEAVLAAWEGNLPGLNQLQQDAINTGGLLDSKNIVVMAPTSSGKTMIGELAALKATQSGGRSVFLLPTKALVNEQYERFRRTYGPAGLRVCRATGDYKDEVEAILRGQFDLAIFTYEKFSGLVLSQPYLLQSLSVVVVDEVQTLVDRTRGRDLELLLTLIRSRKDDGIEPQVIALSAVLGDLNGLDSWLDATVVSTDQRPVELEEGVLTQQGTYRYLDANREEQSVNLIAPAYGDARARTLLIPLVAKLVAEGQQVIVVRGVRGEARGAAGYLANSLGLNPASDALAELPTGDPTRSSADLRRCLEAGVAFHISDLAADERRIVEEHFRRSKSQIRVIVATTTLAQGVNLPAETVIMPELSRRLGARGAQWYSVADYKNIAGRAGRLGLTDRGRSIVLAVDSATHSRVWTSYVNGKPEDVNSQLLDPALDRYTIALRVAAIASQRSDDHALAIPDLVAILANTLGAHQQRAAGRGEAFDASALQSVVAELGTAGFLEQVDEDRLKLTELGNLVSSSMMSVQSAVRVASTLRRLTPSELNPPTLLAIAQTTVELDETRLTVNAKGIRKEYATFTSGLQSRGVSQSVIEALSTGNADLVAVAARAKKAMACLLWINGVPLGNIENFVMQHYFDRNASGPIMGVASRTRDVIETIIDMTTEIHPTSDLVEMRSGLPVRLELGIQSDVTQFALAGATLTRANYRALHDAGLTSSEVVTDAGDDTLQSILDGSLEAVKSLRLAVESIEKELSVPSLDELLPLDD